MVSRTDMTAPMVAPAAADAPCMRSGRGWLFVAGNPAVPRQLRRDQPGADAEDSWAEAGPLVAARQAGLRDHPGFTGGDAAAAFRAPAAAVRHGAGCKPWSARTPTPPRSSSKSVWPGYRLSL